MTRSKRMQTIVRLAAHAEQDAARLLLASRRELDEFEQKLEHLKTCRGEYMDQLLQTSGESMQAQRMHELRGFIKRLDEVIGQLEGQRSQKQNVTDQRETAWMQNKNRARVLGDITDRYRNDEIKRAELRLQFEIDDRPRNPNPHK